MRAAVQRWAIERVLHGARAALARAETPAARARADARGRRLSSRGANHYEASPPFAIGEARGPVDHAGRQRRRAASSSISTAAVSSPNARAIHDPLLAAIGRAAGARGLMVDYRLAPEHPFPAATDDCFAAWNHMLSSGFDPARVVFAGDSAGGNLALVTAMRARDEGLPLPAAIVLLSPRARPHLQRRLVRAQRRDRPDVPRRDGAQRIQDWYAPGLDLADPRISPLFGTLRTACRRRCCSSAAPRLLLDDTLRYRGQGCRARGRPSGTACRTCSRRSADSRRATAPSPRSPTSSASTPSEATRGA